VANSRRWKFQRDQDRKHRLDRTQAASDAARKQALAEDWTEPERVTFADGAHPNSIDCLIANGFTYVVTCDVPGFPVKIGHAKDLVTRMANIAVCNPFRLVVLAVAVGSDYEEVLHRMFRGRRLRGEWFDASVGVALVDLFSQRGNRQCLRCIMERPCEKIDRAAPFRFLFDRTAAS
jgi:hypothetical protein